MPDIDVLPEGVKEEIDNYIGSESNTEELTKMLKELDEKAELSDVVKASIAKIVALMGTGDTKEAKTELVKLLGYYGYGGASPKEEEQPEKKSFQFHLKIKSVSDEDDEKREITGFASVTGVIDRDGEVMDRHAFDEGLEDYMKGNPIVLLNHDSSKPIGTVLDAVVKKEGLWIRAKIAEGTTAAEEAWKLIKQSVLRSFSVGGLFEKIKNKIIRWDLTEISIVSVPANQRATFSIAKAFENGNDLTDSKVDEYVKSLEEKKDLFYVVDTKFIDEVVSQLMDLKYSGDPETEEKAKAIYETCIKEVDSKMPQDVNEIVNVVKSKLAEEATAEAEKKESQELHDKGIAETAVKKFREELKTNSGIDFPEDETEAGPDGARVKVFGKYDHFDLEDLTFAKMFYGAAGVGYSMRELNGALAEKAVKHYEGQGRKDFGEGIKADELNYSTSSGYGDEWVPTLEASTLWAKIQLAAKVAPLFKSIAMPSNPYEYPLDVSGPTIYTVAEAVASTEGYPSATPGTSSRIVTGKKTFTAKKMGALTYFSEELVEDAIIPVLSQLKADFYDAMTRGLDRALISGDEAGATSTTNISHDGAEESAAAWYACTDGLRHQALIVDTTFSPAYDVGVPTYDDIRQVQRLMGTGGKYGMVPSDLVLICDTGIAMALADLDEAITIDKLGPKATILTGMLAAIKGIAIVGVEEYDLTDAAGKIHSTAGNNVKGSFLIVNKRGAMLAYRRKLTMVVDRIPYSDMRYIIASLRFDIQYREHGIVALGYNATI